MSNYKKGLNTIISNKAIIGDNTYIAHNCIIEDDVVIEKDSYIDSNTIIRKGTKLGTNSFVGSNCIIGEYLNKFCVNHISDDYALNIGNNAVIRSGTIIYTDSNIGNNFNTGHRVTIREESKIGNNVSVGTLSDIQGNCKIADYVRMHSNVHLGQLSIIDSFVWIFPYVVLTNDPTPPSDELLGVHVHPFAIIATGSVLLPGVEVYEDSLIGACSIVTKDVSKYAVVVGNPAKQVSDIRKIKNKITGQLAYPWRYHFKNYMPCY